MDDESDSREREHAEDDLPEPVRLPSWAPVVIGLVLVIMAAFAIYTGVRYREDPFGRRLMRLPLPERHQAAPSPGAPGEPQAGASRVFHGPGGAEIPKAGELGPEPKTRITIEGDAEGIRHQMRLSARRGMQLEVDPGEAVVLINDEIIGQARQFDRLEEIYEFAEAGTFTVRLTAPGYRDLVYTVRADPDAADEVARIRVRMERQ